MNTYDLTSEAAAVRIETRAILNEQLARLETVFEDEGHGDISFELKHFLKDFRARGSGINGAIAVARGISRDTSSPHAIVAQDLDMTVSDVVSGAAVAKKIGKWAFLKAGQRLALRQSEAILARSGGSALATNRLVSPLGGNRALNGLRNARNFMPAMTQKSGDTCGLHCVGDILDEIAPRSATTIKLGNGTYTFSALFDNAGRGLNTNQIRQLINQNVGEDLAAIITHEVSEETLPLLVQRGPVIAHVDGNHFVRVLDVVEDGGSSWVRIYDPARGNYEQLLSSFITRAGAQNQMILVPLRPPTP